MPHTREEVLQHIVSYLRTKLEGVAQIDENSHFTRDLNVDSLQVFETVGELEETYDIVIPLELLYRQKIQTVAELANEVMRLIEKN